MSKSPKAASTPSSNSPKWLSAQWTPYLILSILWAIIYGFTFDDKLNLGGDNAVYYILGDAIASGKGYVNVHLVSEQPSNHFPPGYPAILGFFMLFSKSITFLKVVNGLFLLGATLLSFRIFEKITENRSLALVIAGLMLFNGNLLESATIMMSEIPFLFFGMLTVYLFMLTDKDGFLKDWRFWLMLLIASFSFHIRTAGIALIGGLVMYMLVNKQWMKTGVFLGGFVALGTPWFLRGQALGGSAYLKQLTMINPYRPEDGAAGLGDYFTRLLYNIERYVSVELPRSFFWDLDIQYTNYMREVTGEELPPGAVIEVYWAIGILLVALTIFGVYSLKKYRTFVAFYMLGTAGILLLWPYIWFGTRFILPLIPFLLFAWVVGIQSLLKLIGVKKLNPLLFAVLVIFFIPAVKKLHESVDMVYPPKYKDFLQMAQYVNQNTPADAIVVNRKPGLFYLYGRRKSSKFPSTFDYEEMRQFMDDNGVTHVIVDMMGFADVGRYLVPFIQANPEKFQVIQQIQMPNGGATSLLTYNPNYGYEGEWAGEDDGEQLKQRTGQGLYRFNDGRIFDGHWQNGIRQGVGVMQFTNGSKLSGSWMADTLNGPAALLSESGDTLLFGTYTEEEFVRYNKQGIEP